DEEADEGRRQDMWSVGPARRHGGGRGRGALSWLRVLWSVAAQCGSRCCGSARGGGAGGNFHGGGDGRRQRRRTGRNPRGASLYVSPTPWQGDAGAGARGEGKVRPAGDQGHIGGGARRHRGGPSLCRRRRSVAVRRETA